MRGTERPGLPEATLNNRFFTGHERDKESGLDYMVARYYSSSLSRFMEVDPGDDSNPENPQSWNQYTYASNNPLSLIDPSGEAAVGFPGLSKKDSSGIKRIIRDVHGEPGIGDAKIFKSGVFTRYGQAKAAAKWLAAQYVQNPKEAIVLVGHSKGAKSAVKTAEILDRMGIRVTLLVTIDPAPVQGKILTVSGNVDRAINYFQTMGRPGGTLLAGPRVINIQRAFSHGDLDNVLANSGEVSGIIRSVGAQQSFVFESGYRTDWSKPMHGDSGWWPDRTITRECTCGIGVARPVDP